MAKKSQAKTPRIDEKKERRRTFFQKVRKTCESIEPWVPWILAGFYSISMAYLTFRYHTVGGLDVETDFYAELYPQAKKLIEGQFSPVNYGAKGPVYSFLLAGTYGVVRDYFKAAQVLNIFSGALFIGMLYYLVKLVFNRITALLVTFIIITNYMFQNFTYQVGSDMPFMVMCACSMYFLFRNTGTCDRIVSALFALLAFLTRYNGVFLVFGTVLYYASEHVVVRERLKRIGLWLGVFIVAGLPWFIPNWLITGNPVHNDNYINVMLEFYGRGSTGIGYENWTHALPKQFTSLGDIFLYDPVYFLKKMGANVIGHFMWDMRALVEWRLGICVMLGILVFVLVKPSKRMLVYFSFGFFYFLILTLIFYNARFSLYLLAFYAPLAVMPFTNEKITRRLGRFSWIPAALVVLVTLSYAYTSTGEMLDNIRYTPYFLKDMGLALGKYEPDKTQKLLARKPHVAYYAGLVPSMFPGDDVQTVDELIAYCRTHGIRYILYSLVEAKYRPQLQELLDPRKEHPGLEVIYSGIFGYIYKVTSG